MLFKTNNTIPDLVPKAVENPSKPRGCSPVSFFPLRFWKEDTLVLAIPRHPTWSVDLAQSALYLATDDHRLLILFYDPVDQFPQL